MVYSRVNVAVVGSGPAGLAAAVAAFQSGATVLLIERDTRLGGRLNQIVDDFYELEDYEHKLTGPELVVAQSSILLSKGVATLAQTHVLNIVCVKSVFHLTLSNRHGIMQVEADKVILATGAYEQPARQSALHGTRPAGVLTAGAAQYYINVLGQIPAQKATILGSCNIALNLARRLTLEGANVLCVNEPLSDPQGTFSMVSDCLHDYGIPFHPNHTMTRLIGTDRLKAVEIHQTTRNGEPMRGTNQAVKCDTLFLSTKLLSDTELARSLGLEMCPNTHGPICDQNNMTMLGGLFACGNTAQIHTDPNHLTESGRNAGLSAARYFSYERQVIKVNANKDFLTVFPQYIDVTNFRNEFSIYFRVAADSYDKSVRVIVNSYEVFSEDFVRLRPQQTMRISVNVNSALSAESKIELKLDKRSVPETTAPE